MQSLLLFVRGLKVQSLLLCFYSSWYHVTSSCHLITVPCHLSHWLAFLFQASYGDPTNRKAVVCSKHRTLVKGGSQMVHLWGMCRREGCQRNASFGSPVDGQRQFCAQHMDPEKHINTKLHPVSRTLRNVDKCQPLQKLDLRTRSKSVGRTRA